MSTADEEQENRRRVLREWLNANGGPKAVRATGYTLAINCATGVVHLKDRDGVSFAGSQTGTEAMRHLKAYICEAPIARR